MVNNHYGINQRSKKGFENGLCIHFWIMKEVSKLRRELEEDSAGIYIDC